jgi:hypothetical protein
MIAAGEIIGTKIVPPLFRLNDFFEKFDKIDSI